MLSFEYLLDNDPSLSEKENFKLKEGSGNIYAFGARKYGKSLITEIIDILISMVLLDKEIVGFSSYDAIHIRGILEIVIQVLENHPLFDKLLEPKINRSPNFHFYLKSGYTLDSINYNLGSKNPGGQFYQKHLTRLYGEEQCIDGHTKIRYYNDKNELQSKNISYLINSGEWKKIEVLSYNLKEKKIERKKINKIFKKQVKNYNCYLIKTSEKIGNSFKQLKISQKQKLFVNNAYKTPDNIKIGDKLYLLDHNILSHLQKEVLMGCLLGDACILKRGVNSILGFVHGQNQKDYLLYKSSIFKEHFTSYRKNKGKGKITFSCKNRVKPVLNISSKDTRCLNEFSNFKYCKIEQAFSKIDFNLIEKYFSKISLAFWFMDDGTNEVYKHKKDNGVTHYIELCSHAFDLETNQKLSYFLKKKFNLISIIKIENRFKRKYYYLHFDKENSKKFVEIVKPYIVDNLLYKIGNIKRKFIDLTSNTCGLFPTTITSIKKENFSSWTMYDFEVEDNHNFFGNTLLISNSFETEEVFKKRLDAISELGCVERLAGMTNFIKHSPSGRIFSDPYKKAWISNYPQYVRPQWDEKERNEALRKHGGASTASFRIYVEGEIVTDGIAVFDMERVRRNRLEDREIKHFEINKDNFEIFENIIILDRPGNSTSVYIAADIGESAPTEIIILAEINKKYRYLYNITCYNLTDKQQYKIFKYIAEKIEANVIGLDTSEGTGRAIYRGLEEIFPKEHLCWVAFQEKIDIDFEKDEFNRIKFKDGFPVYKQEFVADWSIIRLKKLLYDELMEIPLDFKFEIQINSTVSMLSGKRLTYQCLADQDHLISAFRIFAIMQHQYEFKIMKSLKNKKRDKTGC
jgi:hypothetical protein